MENFHDYFLRALSVALDSKSFLFFVTCVFLQIPDEILLHLSAGLLVTRSPRTVFPKDKEGECAPFFPSCVRWVHRFGITRRTAACVWTPRLYPV